jgi:serine/threonine protein kinase
MTTPRSPSSLLVVCPNPACRKTLSVNTAQGGQARRCPYCATAFQVKGLTEQRASDVAAPPAPEGTSKSAAPAMIGPYQVSGELGRGAFGVVYQGFDAALKREVAIKVLNRSAIGSTRAVERFLREAQVVAGMHHNHIVPVYQLGEHEGGYYIASRFIRGATLADIIPEQGMPATAAVELMLQLLDALAYAHEQGVIHRDVKPDNALLDEKGQLYLTDFGLAGWIGRGQLTQEGTVLGTPSYMAPEQARGEVQQITAAADQYSAGVVLYEMLTGHQPFEPAAFPILIHNIIHTPPPPLTEHCADACPRLQAICLKALSKQAEDRFADCRAMAGALRDWLAGRAGPSPAPAAELPVLEALPADERPSRRPVVRAQGTADRETGRAAGFGEMDRSAEAQTAIDPEPRPSTERAPGQTCSVLSHQPTREVLPSGGPRSSGRERSEEGKRSRQEILPVVEVVGRDGDHPAWLSPRVLLFASVAAVSLPLLGVLLAVLLRASSGPLKPANNTLPAEPAAQATPEQDPGRRPEPTPRPAEKLPVGDDPPKTDPDRTPPAGNYSFHNQDTAADVAFTGVKCAITMRHQAQISGEYRHPNGTVTISISGQARLRLTGACARVIIRQQSGQTTLHLRDLTIGPGGVEIRRMSGQSHLFLGKCAGVIDITSMAGACEVRCKKGTKVVGRDRVALGATVTED